VRELLVLLGSHAPRLRDLYENAASVATIAGQALDLYPIAKVGVPGNDERDHNIVTLGQIVL
jgi:hypothetical protein